MEIIFFYTHTLLSAECADQGRRVELKQKIRQFNDGDAKVVAYLKKGKCLRAKMLQIKKLPNYLPIIINKIMN